MTASVRPEFFTEAVGALQRPAPSRRGTHCGAVMSAICPNRRILLVEANSPAFADLGTAVNGAVSPGAKFISNSYGGAEFSAEEAMPDRLPHWLLPGWFLLLVVLRCGGQPGAYFRGGLEQGLRLRVADLGDVVAGMSRSSPSPCR